MKQSLFSPPQGDQEEGGAGVRMPHRDRGGGLRNPLFQHLEGLISIWLQGPVVLWAWFPILPLGGGAHMSA